MFILHLTISVGIIHMVVCLNKSINDVMSDYETLLGLK